MRHFLYAFSILLVVGSALTIELYYGRKKIKKYARILGVVAIFYLALSFTDIAAHNWGVWDYGLSQTFHTRFFGVEVETYAFVVGTGLTVSIPTLLWADSVDNDYPLLPTLKHKDSAHPKK